MSIKIDDLLRVATTHGASDLHLKAGAFPMMRVGGELYPLADVSRLKPEDTLDVAFSLMSNRQKATLQRVVRSGHRLRHQRPRSLSRQYFPQRGTVSVVMRVIPDQNKSTSDLGLPPVIDKISDEKAWSYSGYRLDRIRKVDDARSDYRSH